MENKILIERFIKNGTLKKEEYVRLINHINKEETEILREEAVRLRKKYYGNKVYVRGLIEFTNYCKNNCYYCGIQASNQHANRYRLSEQEILECCQVGHELGFRTFVLQGGEDPFFTDEKLVALIHKIKERFSDCALTLSIGEKSKESYQAYKKAGADRYLLRHETANETHYKILHPETLSLSNRKRCLQDLKECGFQVGAGFMVGSPGQTAETVAEDFIFLKELQPQMVGIGPFIPHHETKFAGYEAGSLEKTLLYLSIIRIILPKVLLPATTALGTIDSKGREMGILSGANVVMPNLSPVSYRKQYELYDNKICTGDESAQCKSCLQRRMESIGYEVVEDRGDALY